MPSYLPIITLGRTGLTVTRLGIGGAYPESGLKIGQVACAEVEIYGDLGADSPAGFLDMEALGMTVVAGERRSSFSGR